MQDLKSIYFPFFFKNIQKDAFHYNDSKARERKSLGLPETGADPRTVRKRPSLRMAAEPKEVSQSVQKQPERRGRHAKSYHSKKATATLPAL